MTPRLDIAQVFAAAGIALETDGAAVQRELERRGWRVQLEAPLQDDRRRAQGNGNRHRALAFRVRPDMASAGSRFADHALQTGSSPDDALRKLLASILQREARR